MRTGCSSAGRGQIVSSGTALNDSNAPNLVLRRRVGVPLQHARRGVARDRHDRVIVMPLADHAAHRGVS